MVVIADELEHGIRIAAVGRLLVFDVGSVAYVMDFAA